MSLFMENCKQRLPIVSYKTPVNTTSNNDMEGINKSRQSNKEKLHIVLFAIFYRPERVLYYHPIQLL